MSALILTTSSCLLVGVCPVLLIQNFKCIINLFSCNLSYFFLSLLPSFHSLFLSFLPFIYLTFFIYYILYVYTFMYIRIYFICIYDIYTYIYLPSKNPSRFPSPTHTNSCSFSLKKDKAKQTAPNQMIS